MKLSRSPLRMSEVEWREYIMIKVSCSTDVCLVFNMFETCAEVCFIFDSYLLCLVFSSYFISQHLM